MIRSSGSVPSARHCITRSIAIAVPCTALFTTASTSTVSLCIHRSVAMMLTSDGSTLSGSRCVSTTYASGYSAKNAGSFARYDGDFSTQRSPAAAPLQELQEAPVRAEHRREIGARQPARVARHRVRAHEVIRRELEHVDQRILVGNVAAVLVHRPVLGRDEMPERVLLVGGRDARIGRVRRALGRRARVQQLPRARDAMRAGPARAARAGATFPTGRCRRRAPATSMRSSRISGCARDGRVHFEPVDERAHDLVARHDAGRAGGGRPRLRATREEARAKPFAPAVVVAEVVEAGRALRAVSSNDASSRATSAAGEPSWRPNALSSSTHCGRGRRRPDHASGVARRAPRARRARAARAVSRCRRPDATPAGASRTSAIGTTRRLGHGPRARADRAVHEHALGPALGVDPVGNAGIVGRDARCGRAPSSSTKACIMFRLVWRFAKSPESSR